MISHKYEPKIKSPLCQEIDMEAYFKDDDDDDIEDYDIEDYDIEDDDVELIKLSEYLRRVPTSALKYYDTSEEYEVEPTKAVNTPKRTLVGPTYYDSLLKGRIADCKRSIMAVPFILKMSQFKSNPLIYENKFEAYSYFRDQEEGYPPYVASIHIPDAIHENYKMGKSKGLVKFSSTLIADTGKLTFDILNEHKARIKRINIMYNLKELPDQAKALVRQTDTDYLVEFTVGNYNKRKMIIGNLNIVFHNVKKDVLPSSYLHKQQKSITVVPKVSNWNDYFKNYSSLFQLLTPDKMVFGR